MLLRDKTCHSEAHARNLIVLCTQQGILPPCGRQNDMIVIPSVCEESPAIRKRFFGASHLRMTCAVRASTLCKGFFTPLTLRSE